MKEISMKLKCHAPWCKFSINQNDLSYEEVEHKFWTDIHKFNCENLCCIEFDNMGGIHISFVEEQSLHDIKIISAILLYFISLCNGFNCEYDPTAIIDCKIYQNFFSFAQEDKTLLPLVKNQKFYDISLEDIQDNFSHIMSVLLSPNNRRYFLALLSNYYALTVYKDFVGNGEYRFRNIVTVLESLITLINSDKYAAKEAEHANFLQEMKKQELFSNSQIDKHILAKGMRLQDKIIDIFDYAKRFGLNIKLDSSKESQKIADTRNFISHLFTTEKEFLNSHEISNYTAAFQILFRMIFLNYYGVNVALIKNSFLRNEPNRELLQQIFNIE